MTPEQDGASTMLQRVLVIFHCLLFCCLGNTALACSYLHSIDLMVEYTNDKQHAILIHNDDLNSGKYHKSGLYKINGPAEPLWSADEYDGRVVLANNLRYSVQLQGSAKLGRERRHRNISPQEMERLQHLDSPVVSFYDAGQFLHDYRLGDLYEDHKNAFENVPCGRSAFELDYAVDNSLNQFKLLTREYRSFTFSLTTGEIVGIDTYNALEYRKLKSIAAEQSYMRRSKSSPSDLELAQFIDSVVDLYVDSYNPDVIERLRIKLYSQVHLDSQ